MKGMKKMDISIDIGTSFSSICMKDRSGKISPVYVRTGVNMFGNDFAIPTAVCVDGDGNLKLGQAAMNIQKQYPSNFAGGFKRNLGEEFPIHLGNEDFAPEELYSRIFIYFKECAEKVSSEKIDKVFITYPASYTENDPRKRKIIGAAKSAGLFNVTLIDEPTAAAMNYMDSGLLPGGALNLMIYDFGGGTFDVSLLRYENGKFELICEPDGDPECGGIDIDRIIYNDIRTQLSEQFSDDMQMLAKVPLRMVRLNAGIQEEAVKAKHELSTSQSIQQAIPIGFDNMIYNLTREKFDGLIAHLATNSITACRNILQKADMKVNDLSAIIMVGGTSRVPLVQSMLKKFAGKVPVLCAPNMDLAVVEGALKYSALERQTPKEPVPKPPVQKTPVPKEPEHKQSEHREPPETKLREEKEVTEKPKPVSSPGEIYQFLCLNCAEKIKAKGREIEILRTDSEKSRCDRCNKKAYGHFVRLGAAKKEGVTVNIPAPKKSDWTKNVLKSDRLNECKAGSPVFGTSFRRTQVVEITFIDNIKNAPKINYDISEKGDRSVLLWFETLGYDKYRMMIGADGGVNGKNCAWLFENYINLKEIHLNHCLHLEQATSTAGLFAHCHSLWSVDLSGLITSNVENMTAMFDDCSSWASPDVSSFDTSHVKYMNAMFRDCKKLIYLDLSGFDFKNVIDISSMFKNCERLRNINRQDIYVPVCRDMSYALYRCLKLEQFEDIRYLENEVSCKSALTYCCATGKKFSEMTMDEHLTVFMARCPFIIKNQGYFTETSLNTLRQYLKVPAGEPVFLAHDDTLIGSGKNGFVIARSGIYVKELWGTPYHISWHNFKRSDIRDYYFIKDYSGNEKALAYYTKTDASTPNTHGYYLRHGFFTDLQKYLNG